MLEKINYTYFLGKNANCKKKINETSKRRKEVKNVR
jgi:hypothetical protein